MAMSFEEWKRQKGSKESGPKTDFSDMLWDYGAKGAQAVLKPIEPVVDILSRPGTALSEAYGAYKAGDESEVGAAWRGLSEGYEGAKYGTMGEQLLGEEAHWLPKLGIDIATDPLVFAGGPVARGARAAVGAGLRATGKAAHPVLTALKATGPVQGVSRFVMPLSKIPEVFAPQSGGQISSLAREAQEAMTFRMGQMARDFEGKLSQLSLHKPKDAARRMAAMDVIEKGVPSGDAAVDDLAGWLNDQFRAVGREVEDFRDSLGEGFKVFDPASGETSPFAMLQNYVPRMFKQDWEESLSSTLAKLDGMDAARLKHLLKTPKSRYSDTLAKQLKIPSEQAQQIIRNYAGRPNRVGHIERVRQDLDPMLAQFLERDPAQLFPRYMEKVTRRVETARKFDVDHGKLNQLIDLAHAEGMPLAVASDLTRWAKGEAPASLLGMDSKLRGVMALQAMAKLGPTTMIANLSQMTNTIVTEGLGSTLRHVGAAIPGSAERSRFMSSYLGGLRDHLRMVTGSADATGGPGRAARAWLKYTGFTPVEEINRVVSAAAGTDRAGKLAQKYLQFANEGKKIPKYLRDDLTKRGVTLQDILSYDELGKFSDDALERIGLKASQKTQHATNYLELPPGWRTPEAKVALQFKRFAYNQSRFLYEEIAKPAHRYFVTNGQEGTIAPLGRALAAYGVGGTGVNAAREGLRDLQAWTVGAKRRQKKDTFDKHPTLTTLRNMMYVGSFGMVGDVASQAARGRLSGWLLGPTVGDVVDLSERLAMTGAKVAHGEEGPSLEDMLLGMYRYAGRGALGVAPSELKTASAERGLPGLIGEIFP